MPPVRNYTKWNERYSDNLEKRDPKGKYFIIAEGNRTERSYFKGYVDYYNINCKDKLIDTIYLEKTENDKGITKPLELIQFAEKTKKNGDITFCEETDKMIVVFDADIYKNDSEEYKKVLNEGKKYKDVLAVTYPSFELFLILHKEDAYSRFLKNDKNLILENRIKSKKKTYIYSLANRVLGFDVKSRGGSIKKMINNINIAIKEEKEINNDIDCAIGQLTSNVADVLDKMLRGIL